MNPLLQHLHSHSQTPLHTAIVIGAGNGRALPEWRQLDAEHLLLVEAHPQLAEELNRRLQPERNEQLLNLAITAAPCNEARLLSFNNPAYSSLNAPAALQEHYPNLRPLETLAVPARSIGQLLDEPELDAEATHLLQIEAPGQALELLQAIPTETLQAFTWLIVGCASEPLYENDASAETITSWLQEIGFDCLQEDPDAIYPQSRLLLQRNPASVQRQRLHAEIATLRQQLLQQQNNSQQQFAALEQEKAALIAARDALTQDKQALTQARDEQAGLAAERQAQLDALSQEKADLTATRDALVQDKQALAQARDEQAKLAAERQAQLDALSKEKAALIATRDALTQDKQALTQARDEQARLAAERQTQLDKLKAECDQAQKTASERQKTLEQAQQRIKTLENEASENLQRQQLLQEELIKAEAQIELIKDLLLREPGL